MFGITWPIQDIIPFDIMHLKSYESHAILGDRTTRLEYQRIRAEVTRPLEGVQTTFLTCQYCSAKIKINVQSKKYVIQPIKRIFMGAVPFLVIAIIAGFFADPTSESKIAFIVSAVSAILFIFCVLIIGALVSSLYWGQGIGIVNTEIIRIGKQEFAKHNIDLNVDPLP